MAKAKAKTTTKQKTKKPQAQSDFFTVMLWLSVLGALSYIMTLHPAVIRDILGDIPTGWHVYWATSGLLFLAGLVWATQRKLRGVKILMTISLADAVLPILLFSQLRTRDSVWDALFNIIFVGLWLTFIRRNPKFLS